MVEGGYNKTKTCYTWGIQLFLEQHNIILPKYDWISLYIMITDLSTIRCLLVSCCTVTKTFFLKSWRSLKQFLSLAAEENPLLSSSRISSVTSNLKTRLLTPVTIVEESTEDCFVCCFLFKRKQSNRFV